MTTQIAWPVVQLGTLATFKNGLNFAGTSWGKGLKIIGVSDFKDRIFPNFASLDQINPQGVVRPKDLLQTGDIVFVRSNGNRELIGRCLYLRSLEEPVSHSGFTIRLRFEAKNVCTPFYVYLFRSHLIRRALSDFGGGTNINNLNQDILSKLVVPLPCLATQQKIAAILSTYDDLIANNQRRITLLERMAEDIYREWFVRLRFPGHEQVSRNNGLPQGWAIKKLKDICDITYGFPFQGDRFNTTGNGRPIIRIRNIPIACTSDFTDEVADPKYIIRAGDLLIGMDGDFHINHWLGDDAYLVQRSCRVKAKNPLLDGYIARAIAAPINYFQQTIVGATVGHLGAKHLNSIEILVPSNDQNPQLELLNSLLKQRLHLGAAIGAAQSTRDALLPRLISGKLAVDGLDIRFPPEMAPSAP